MRNIFFFKKVGIFFILGRIWSRIRIRYSTKPIRGSVSKWKGSETLILTMGNVTYLMLGQRSVKKERNKRKEEGKRNSYFWSLGVNPQYSKIRTFKKFAIFYGEIYNYQRGSKSILKDDLENLDNYLYQKLIFFFSQLSYFKSYKKIILKIDVDPYHTCNKNIQRRFWRIILKI